MSKPHSGFRSVQKALAARPDPPKARTGIPGAKKAMPAMPPKKGKC